MITPGEYTLLLTDEVQRAIAANRGRDPLEVALDRNIPHARLVATQVKYLARAEAKLPSYASAQCILPPLAFGTGFERSLLRPQADRGAEPSSTSPADWAPTPFSWRAVSAA